MGIGSGSAEITDVNLINASKEQVTQHGDLANWDTGQPGAIPAVGGAMNLVFSARRMFVVMEHVDKKSMPKIVPECTYP